MVRRFSRKRTKRAKFGKLSRSNRKRKVSKKKRQSFEGCSISNNKVIEWELDKKHVTDLYKYLYDNIEHGGKFPLSTRTKKSSKSIKSNTGEKDSVDAPDAIVNWHTHPISCYLGEKTVWGWPSGEDMRETIIFGLRGSACHAVPSVEGVYLIQPNPCVVTSLINLEHIVDIKDYPKIAKLVKENEWGDFLRGIIILAIEIYFRSTHVFRTTDYINEYPETTAQDFVDFTNVFQLMNMFKKYKIEGCSVNVGCNQIYQFENKRVENVPFKKYVKVYESDTNIHLISKKGVSRSTKHTLSECLDKGVLPLLKKLALGNDCNFPIKKWHTGRIFLITLYRNKVKYTNEYIYYDKLSNEQKWEFLNEHKNGPKNSIQLENKKMKFYLFDMKGKCDHSSLVKHINNFSTRTIKGQGLEVIGDNSCKFCRTAKERAKENNLKVKFYFDFGGIQQAIQEASQKAGHQVTSIPAYFKDGVYQDYPPF